MPDAARPLVALIVDDEADARLILKRVAEKAGFHVVEGCDGNEAVSLQAATHPDFICLDIEMPGMSGLDALRDIHDADPHVPVVIVSGAQAADIGQRAFDLGAVNYIGKPFDVREIRFVIDRIRGAIEEKMDLQPALALLKERRTVLEMPNDLALLTPVVAYLGKELEAHYPGFDVPVTEVRLALYEAIANALEHGNLEIDYDTKTEALTTDGGIRALIERRRHEPKYLGRRVRIQADYDPTTVIWRVRDEGPGFSPSTEETAHALGDPTSLHGRGIRLMRHLMDEVAWNPSGNEIRLTMNIVRQRTNPKV
jgi:DNA-binding response OmpR family regulator